MSNNYKVTMIHRYFWPDSAPYGNILFQLALSLPTTNKIRVLTSQPSYKNTKISKKLSYIEKIHNISIFRLHPKSFYLKPFEQHFLIFQFSCWICFNLLFSSTKYVTISTSPPVVLPFLVVLISKIKKYKVIYHCMDIYPEISFSINDFTSISLFKFLQFIDTFTCNNAYKVLVLSEDMKNSLLHRTNFKNVPTVVQNIPAVTIDANSKFNDKIDPDFDSLLSTSKLNIVYAGNIGRFQSLETFLEIFLKSNLSNLNLTIIGSGSRSNSLKAILERYHHSTNTVKVLPQTSQENVKKVLLAADIGLVSLIHPVCKYAFPSKIITYIDCYLPLFFCSDNQSSIANLINIQNVGFTADIQRPQMIHDQLIKINSLTKSDISNMKYKVKTRKHLFYDSQKTFSDFSSLLS